MVWASASPDWSRRDGVKEFVELFHCVFVSLRNPSLSQGVDRLSEVTPLDESDHVVRFLVATGALRFGRSFSSQGVVPFRWLGCFSCAFSFGVLFSWLTDSSWSKSPCRKARYLAWRCLALSFLAPWDRS